MDYNLSLHLKLFNSKVRAMNQAGAKLLTLNADEARNLQADIFELLGTIAEFNKRTAEPEVTQVAVDGGSFK